jgi:hypothetical protein
VFAASTRNVGSIAVQVRIGGHRGRNALADRIPEGVVAGLGRYRVPRAGRGILRPVLRALLPLLLRALRKRWRRNDQRNDKQEFCE